MQDEVRYPGDAAQNKEWTIKQDKTFFRPEKTPQQT